MTSSIRKTRFFRNPWLSKDYSPSKPFAG